MPCGFDLPLCGTLGLQFQLGEILVILFGIQLRQPARHRHRQTDIRHGGYGGRAAAGGLPQLPLGEGNPEPHALAGFRKALHPAGGVLRRVGRQQDHAGVPRAGHGLHRLFAHFQIPAPEAQTDQGENLLIPVHSVPPVLPPWRRRPPGGLPC